MSERGAKGALGRLWGSKSASEAPAPDAAAATARQVGRLLHPPQAGPGQDLIEALRRHRRALHQAQAVGRDARRPRGRTGRSRPRSRHGRAHHRDAAQGPLREGHRRRRRARGLEGGSRARARPRRTPARGRRRVEAVRHPRRRRQRHRQDHDDRQARRSFPSRGQKRDARGRRHIPRRRHRSAEDLGRADGLRGGRGCGRCRRSGSRVRCR